MDHPYWPLLDLRIKTPRLELRAPTEGDFVELVDVIRGGVHDVATMPFLVPWTDAPSPALERGSMQWWWRQWAEWSPEHWHLTAAVFVDGRPVGVQDLGAEQFRATRTVTTGSWLGLPYQGQGLGTEMRSAVLHLAFDGLGAVEAYSGAWADNAPSLAVSARLGYVPNGEQLLLRRGQPARQIGLRLTRAIWEHHRRDDIEIEGLEACREMFGA